MLSETERWRQKYFDQLATTEQEETSLRNRMRTLERLLFRVTAAVQGVDSELDCELLELHALLQQEGTDLVVLDTLVKQVEQSVQGLDRRRQRDTETVLGTLCSLVDQLLGCELPESHKAALVDLGNRLQQRVAGLQRYPVLLAEYGRLQAQALQQIAPPPPTARKAGFLDRFFSRVALDSPEHYGYTAGDLAATDPEPTAIVDQLSASLRSLVEQLPLPGAMHAELSQLKSRLDAGADSEALLDVFDAVVDLVLSALGRGQQEFELFLQSLDERLNGIQQVLDRSQANHSSSRNNNAELQHAVRRHVTNLQASMQAGPDVESLMSTVNSNLDSILDSLDRFMQKEAEREQSADAQLGELQQRLSQMEEDSRELQQQVIREQQRALTDALTGLPNRVAYEQRAQLELQRWDRNRCPLTVAVLDIDKLKAINDEYGHLAGDKVIQLISKEVASLLGEADFIARYGGEEFVILLPEKDLAAAAQALEKVQEQVARLPFHFRNQRVRITVSIGLCEMYQGRSWWMCSTKPIRPCTRPSTMAATG
ncbi:GGDEF domain-containing protein [Marinobacterium aestuariivivens]|uniref:diguanylate cyclase n=1 Tax=Marinobacterium aestuariivivens TaxID=1698799 RepID=A0ABW1ZSJ3_9GAMM